MIDLFSNEFLDPIRRIPKFGSRITSQIIEAGRNLYNDCFKPYLQKLRGCPVQYLVISESPPGIPGGATIGDYFYKKERIGNRPLPNLSGSYPTTPLLVLDHTPHREFVSFAESLQYLTEKGFILVDLLFLPLKFENKERKEVFPLLIPLYFPRLVEILSELDFSRLKGAALTYHKFAVEFRKFWNSDSGIAFATRCPPHVRDAIAYAQASEDLSEGQAISFKKLIK